MTHRDLVGHAHAPVELHRLLANEPAGVPHYHLGGRQSAAALAAPRLGGAHGGKIAHRARLLDMDEHVRHPVLQRLEPRDGNAELLARLRVLDRRVEDGLQGAHRLRAAHCAALVERRLEAGERGPFRADERARRVGQLDVGGGHAVERPVGRQRDARSLARDRKQRDARGLVRSAGRAGRDQQQIRSGSVQDHRLAPFQRPAAAAAPRRGGDALQIVARAGLEVRRHRDPLARREGGEDLVALLRRA